MSLGQNYQEAARRCVTELISVIAVITSRILLSDCFVYSLTNPYPGEFEWRRLGDNIPSGSSIKWNEDPLWILPASRKPRGLLFLLRLWCCKDHRRFSFFSFHENLSPENKKIADDILEKLIALNSRPIHQIQKVNSTSSLKKKRNVYTQLQRKSIISYFNQLDGTISSRVDRINKISEICDEETSNPTVDFLF